MSSNRRPTRLLASELACVRGGRTVFSGLSFAVDAGEALLVSGPNGAGKSSLLRAVAGLVRLTDGRLELADGDTDATLGEQAHYLGHQDALKPSLSVGENLEFWTRYLDGGFAIAPALDAVGLGSIARPAGSVSLGRPAAAALDRAADCGRAPALAARRADLRARCGGADHARDAHAQPPRRRRHDPRRDARPGRIGWREGIAVGRRAMMAPCQNPLSHTHLAPSDGCAPSPHSPSKTGVNALSWGRVGEGGGCVSQRAKQLPPPPLTPPHKGEGNSPRHDREQHNRQRSRRVCA